jgi:hypothetical protein
MHVGSVRTQAGFQGTRGDWWDKKDKAHEGNRVRNKWKNEIAPAIA